MFPFIRMYLQSKKTVDLDQLASYTLISKDDISWFSMVCVKVIGNIAIIFTSKNKFQTYCIVFYNMCGSRVGHRGSRPSLENHKNLGFVSNSGPDPLKNHKATEPAFNVGPSTACQRNAI